jgi:hypothetical protein
MRAWIVASASLLCATSARADVFLDDSTIEISADYRWQPVHFGRQFEPAVGTGLHFEDRNGVFAKFVVATLSTPSDEPDNPYTTSSTKVYAYEYLNGDKVEIYKDETVLKAGYETPEARAERCSEKMKRRAEFLAFNAYMTEFRIWEPRDGTSNIKGAAFGMTFAAVRSGRYSIETGLRWEAIHADVCGDEMSPASCRSKFFGSPLSLLVDLGRIGRLEFGFDWNWRKNYADDTYANVSPVHAGLEIDIIDRLFVRASGLSTTDDITHPGFALEVGGRL